MNRYFVDYENVNREGLKGLESLTKDDTVLILYSNKANTLTFSDMTKIIKCSATVDYKEVPAGSKNALDFCLTGVVYAAIAEDIKEEILANYFIISKDTGFDNFILFCEKEFNCFIKRRESIKAAKATAAVESDVIIKFFLDFDNNAQHAKTIAKVVNDIGFTTQDKNIRLTNINNELQKSFDGKFCKEIIKYIKQNGVLE